MKRWSSLFLCALLLLSLIGCGKDQPSDPTEAAAEDTTVRSEPAPADEDGVVIESLPEAEPDAASESVAAAGEVITDYSSYAPRAPLPEADYERLRKTPMEGLIPGDYGQIFPFAAGELMSYSKDAPGYSYSLGRYYGFVTGDGQIVCDPVFTSIYRMNHYNYGNNSCTPLPLWAMSRTTDMTEVTEGENTWYEGDTWYAVAALDGSWVTPMEFRRIIPVSNGFVGVRSDERYTAAEEYVDFDVFDVNGERLFGSAELRPILGAPNDARYIDVSFSEGVYILQWYPEDAPMVSYALDAQGKVLFGPMQSLGEFSEGLCSASENGETYGFVDKQGKWVIPARFTGVESFHNGLAVCRDGDNPVVIDKNGAERITEHAGYLYASGDYFIFNSDAGMERIYDRTGAIVYRAEYGEYWSLLEGDIFQYSDNDQILTLRNMKSGEVIQLPGVGMLSRALYYSDFMLDGIESTGDYYYEGVPCYLSGRWDEETETYVQIFVDKQFRVIAERTDITVRTFEDSLTGAVYTAIAPANTNYDAGGWELYGPDGTSLGKYSGSIQIYNGWFQQTDDFAARLYDPDGKLVFCYPLLSVLDD